MGDFMAEDSWSACEDEYKLLRYYKFNDSKRKFLHYVRVSEIMIC